MEQYQYMPGDPRLVDQLVYELKSKGIFDQFRKECISDVDTKPAYQNLRQRVESSVSTFLSRQTWKPDLNKNQLREKLRKHIMDGNYLEQGVERIVDQVVNPKVASMFIPQVEDLVYNYFGIKRTKAVLKPETSNGNVENDLLPTDLEAVSPGSVKSNDDKDQQMEIFDNDAKDDVKMEVDEIKPENKVQDEECVDNVKDNIVDESEVTETVYEKSNIPLPAEEIKPEDIPIPLDSPPKVELDKIELPKDTDPSDIPLPGEIPVVSAGNHFKPIALSGDSGDESDSSDGSLRRNMSPLTPVRTFDEDSNDAQAGFDSESKEDDKKDLPVSTFRFTIESKSSESSPDTKTADKKEDLSYQFHNQVNINFNTPLYDDSSNSNNLHIDYESDANSKNIETKSITGTSDKKHKDDKKSSHSSHRHSGSSKDKRTDSKHSSKERHDPKRSDDKKSKDDHRSRSKSSHRERSRDRSDKRDSRESSKHRHGSTHKGSSRDSKHRSSSSSHRQHSGKSDDKKSSSKDSKDVGKTKEHKSSSKSSRDKDRKSSSSKDEKKDKKDKKDDDHYSASGRGNQRRSTDRDSNDGNSSSSKGSNNQNHANSQNSTDKKSEKSSKSSNTTGSDGTSPSDKDAAIDQASNFQSTRAIRVESHLESPAQSPRFMPDVVLKKPKFASNFEEAKRIMKVRQFLDEEQRRMNQEAALLLEFQANVRPGLSQAYSDASGPELEFACVGGLPEVDPERDNVFTDDGVLETKVQSLEVLEETIENIADAIQRCPSELVVEVSVEEVNSDVESQLDASETIVKENLMLLEDLQDDVRIEECDLSVDEEEKLLFFTEQERGDAVQDKRVFEEFMQKFAESVNSKLFLLNCNEYEVDIFKNIQPDHCIVNFTRNGHVRKPKTTTIHVENTELPIPLAPEKKCPSFMFSPVKSESSFDLSSDYDTKLEEMVNSKSRQDIMEIILGSVIPEGSQPVTIDICEDADIESVDRGTKRKICEVESPDNNNQQVLTANKIRRLSGCEVITSTTEEPAAAAPAQHHARSKYLGKARRVGLSRPKKPAAVPSSPSSDKSIENYARSPSPPRAPRAAAPRAPQRYDAADLYKPKLHFLSRRNNVT